MPVVYVNRVQGILDSSISSGSTTFDVVDGSAFPVLQSGEWMYITVDAEVIKVLTTSGNTFTCEPTSVTHTSGTSMEMRLCKELLTDLDPNVFGAMKVVDYEADVMVKLKKFGNI